jgi:hypothetical protein
VRISGRSARGRQKVGTVEAEAFRKRNALGERGAIGLQDEIERKLGSGGIADPADPDLLRAENVQHRGRRFDSARFA